MKNIEQTSAELFDKLRNRFSPIDIRDESRKKTLDPEKARFFSFNYVSDGENLGPITISLLDRSLKIFYATDIDAKMSPEQKRKWFAFLKDLRFFAMPEVKDFDVRDISKSGLNLHDLKYLNKDSDVFTKDEVGIQESKLFGTRRSSYQQLEDVRIIARHSKPIVDETIPGARSRNIESFYIENSQGERFKLPEGTTINGARAYARHIKNGGVIHDDFSKHIGRMIKEMADLRMFVRNMRGRTFEDLQTQQMVESAIDHYGRLHRDLHLIRSQKGYDQYLNLWQPDTIAEESYDLSELRERFVRKVFDERMEDALPVVFREYSRRKMAAEQEFESWAGEMVREFEEKNPTDQHNKMAAKNQKDLEEEDASSINVKSPFANSLHDQERDSADTIVDGDENQSLAGLLNDKGFEFRFNDGIYYFESREEIERAKDWISLKFPKMKFPKMGIYDYGYGVYGSTTFDRELPGGKGVMESINEDLRKWFKEKWVRFGPDGKIRGACARGDDSEGKPKCLPQAKAYALGKKGRKTAASRKRREDPNPERSGPAINVKTKESLAVIEGTESQYIAARYIDEFADGDYWYVKGTPDVIKKFVLLANSLEDEAVKGTEYEPDKGMMAKVHAQLGNDSVPQWTVVKAQNLEQLKPIGNRVLQLLMKPDLSYGAQEFMSEFLWTLEEKGLALVTTEPVQGVAEATGDAKFDNMMTKMVKDASARKDIDTLRAQPIKASPEAALAKFGMELIAQLEKLCRARCGTNRTIQDKPDIEPKLTALSNSNDGGEKVANILLDLYKIDSNALQEFARAFNQHGDWPWQNFAIAWTQGEWADYKRQWMDYIGNLGKGVAEGFTDDLDNIYAMHPQPEKSEQVVFLITGMTEDEFSNRWTDLPDPYQQEFGYDLPLWDADDLSSYPNLAVKRITFDQYVQLVGNYIKSEELAGSTMSRMKQGVAEGKHSCPECGGRLVEFSKLNEKKDACYYKVKSRYKVWPSAYASGALVKCRKKGAKNWGNKSESKDTSANKLLDSFKEDLDKF